MRPVVIAGAGMIRFERRDEDTLVDMLADAGLRAMDDAGLGDENGVVTDLQMVHDTDLAAHENALTDRRAS